MTLAQVASALRAGEAVTFIARGGSMEPRVPNGANVTVDPVHGQWVMKGDVVLAKVNGRWYLHLVTGRRKGQVQISNNKGRVNGWTSEANVVGQLRSWYTAEPKVLLCPEGER